MEECFLNLVNPNQIWIVITLFPVDLAPNGILFGAKSIQGVYQITKKKSISIQIRVHNCSYRSSINKELCSVSALWGVSGLWLLFSHRVFILTYIFFLNKEINPLLENFWTESILNIA